MLLLVGCGAESEPPKKPTDDVDPKPLFTAITPEEAKKLIAENKAVLVDVRTAEEFAKGSAAGALNLQPGDSKPQELADMGATIIVFGADAAQSKAAAQRLAGLGYTAVRDLGAIAESGLEIKQNQDKPQAPEGSGGTGGSGGSGNPGGNGILSSFNGQNIDGGSVNQSIFSGHKLTMINIWATFCGPCINEMPDLGVLSGELAAKGVQIVGVAGDITDYKGNISPSQVSKAKDIISQTGANYLHLAPIGLDAIISLSQYVPTTVFVDAYGNQVGDIVVGAKSIQTWRSIVEERLAKVG